MKFPLTPYTILQRHLYVLFQNQSPLLLLNPVAPWCSGYHCCTTSFIKAWAQVLSRCKSCLRRVGDSRCWGSLTMVPAGNKAKRFSSVNYTTKNNSSLSSSTLLFNKYLNPQVRINKMVNENTCNYHTSPSGVTSRIHPLIFLWTP